MTVGVHGLSCPFCTYGLEKKLKKVAGVQKVETNLAAGSATLILAEGSNFSLDAIRAAVRKAGFTPDEIRMVVVGTLTHEGAEVRLRERGAGREYRLLEASTNGGSDRGEELLGRLARQDALVAVTGAVQEGGGDGFALVVDEVKAVHSLTLAVDGLRDEKSAERLAKALREIDGAYRASVSIPEKRATVESIGRALSASTVIAAVDGIGLEASVLETSDG